MQNDYRTINTLSILKRKINDALSLADSRPRAISWCRQTALPPWYDGSQRESHQKRRISLGVLRGYSRQSLYAADPLKRGAETRKFVIGDGNLAGEELGRLGQQKESARLLDKAVYADALHRAGESAEYLGSRVCSGPCSAMRGDNFLRWKNFKSGLDDYAAAIDIYARLLRRRIQRNYDLPTSGC